MVEAKAFEEFLAWREKHQQPSVADGAAKVRQACTEEDYTFQLPERENRPNPFSDALDGLSR